jgi:hypothetical protein
MQTEATNRRQDRLKIEQSPVHTTAALDRWWMPQGRGSDLAAGGFLVVVP